MERIAPSTNVGSGLNRLEVAMVSLFVIASVLLPSVRGGSDFQATSLVSGQTDRSILASGNLRACMEISQTVTVEPSDPKGLSYVATFCTEYLLTVRSELGSPEGGGWFQSGIATTVRVVSSIPMSGIMGFLGGKWVFDGWYEDGVLVSNSNEAQILVDKPYALEAR